MSWEPHPEVGEHISRLVHNIQIEMTRRGFGEDDFNEYIQSLSKDEFRHLVNEARKAFQIPDLPAEDKGFLHQLIMNWYLVHGQYDSDAELFMEMWDEIIKGVETLEQCSREFRESGEVQSLQVNKRRFMERYLHQSGAYVGMETCHEWMEQGKYQQVIDELQKVLPYEDELDAGDLFFTYHALFSSYHSEYASKTHLTGVERYPGDNVAFLEAWNALRKTDAYWRRLEPGKQQGEYMQGMYTLIAEALPIYAAEYSRRTGEQVSVPTPSSTVSSPSSESKGGGCMGIVLLAVVIVGVLIVLLF